MPKAEGYELPRQHFQYIQALLNEGHSWEEIAHWYMRRYTVVFTTSEMWAVFVHHVPKYGRQQVLLGRNW
jgi:hypothetical protein